MKKIVKLFIGILFLLGVSINLMSCDGVTNPVDNSSTSGTTPITTTTTYSKTYTVIFSANDVSVPGAESATEMPKTQTIVKGSLVTEPSTDPSRTDYTFLGWYTDSACTLQVNFETLTISANTYLYAKWMDNSDTLYTFSFDTGTSDVTINDYLLIIADGDTFDTDDVDDIEQYIEVINDSLLLDSTSKYGISDESGYYVYEDAGFNDPLDTSTTINSTTTLYLEMVPLHFITFDASDGNFSDNTFSFWYYSELAHHNSEYTVKAPENSSLSSSSILPGNPTSDNTAFAGWYSDKDCTDGNKIDTDTASITTDQTLYAKWVTVDADIAGYWTYDTYTLYLDTDTGTGYAFESDLDYSEVAFDNTNITIDDTEYTYTYADTTFTITDSSSNNLDCVALSTTTSASDTPSFTKFVLNDYYLCSLSDDGTCSFEVLDWIPTEEFSVEDYDFKWATDSSNFYLLTEDDKIISSIDITGSNTDFKDCTTDLEGYYYNHAGLTTDGDGNTVDDYSFYLDSDGTYTLYVFGNEQTGTWFATDEKFYYSFSDSYESNDYTMNANILEMSSLDYTQSTTKGTVSSSQIDDDLTGTWLGSIDSSSIEIKFRSDGEMIMTLSMGDLSVSVSYYYRAYSDAGTYISRISFQEADSYEYSLSDDKGILNLDNMILIKQ